MLNGESSLENWNQLLNNEAAQPIRKYDEDGRINFADHNKYRPRTTNKVTRTSQKRFLKVETDLIGRKF